MDKLQYSWGDTPNIYGTYDCISSWLKLVIRQILALGRSLPSNVAPIEKIPWGSVQLLESSQQANRCPVHLELHGLSGGGARFVLAISFKSDGVLHCVDREGHPGPKC